MRIAALTRYTRKGASSRMRFCQYQPWLARAGIAVDEQPLFTDAYVDVLQRGGVRLGHALAALSKRVWCMRKTDENNLVWIEKDALPWLPAWFELALYSRRVPFVLDYDDAVFHQYDQHRLAGVRWALGSKHKALMRRAALVITGNEYLADYARAAGAPEVALLPTVIDLDRYPMAAPVRACSELPTIGWIGQRATAAFLNPLAPVFSSLADRGLARFSAIGIDAQALGLPMNSVPWSEATEVHSISQLDIGVMPLVDGAFERGKCGYKLIQYMACGLPVVASPVGVNTRIVEHGVNGFLAETPQQWAEALATLATNHALRQRMGAAGRAKVEREFALQVTAPRLVALLQQAAATVIKKDSPGRS